MTPASNDPVPSIRVEVEDLNRTSSTAKFYTDRSYAATVNKRLEAYKNLPETFRPALEKTADYIRGTMIPRIFSKEGPGWRPLAPRTISERIAAGYGRRPILYRTGDLFNSLTQKSHPHHIEVIKVGKQSRIEIGSDSRKFIDNQLGNPRTHLPARPMLPGTGGTPFPSTDRIMIEKFFQEIKEHKKNVRL